MTVRAGGFTGWGLANWECCGPAAWTGAGTRARGATDFGVGFDCIPCLLFAPPFACGRGRTGGACDCMLCGLGLCLGAILGRPLFASAIFGSGIRMSQFAEDSWQAATAPGWTQAACSDHVVVRHGDGDGGDDGDGAPSRVSSTPWRTPWLWFAVLIEWGNAEERLVRSTQRQECICIWRICLSLE